ncbi:1,4-alpha-glucan branching protein GlgB [Glutamicibacter sp. NPDC087344]|uniref:1,4-alpha-glucan branching protein GlgB n=1 Tax=Glutamicibacter sp. NPDC087344 TaxID=3363994 RepID=UPI0038262213
MEDEDKTLSVIDAQQVGLLGQGRHPDPFAVLGPTDDGKNVVVRLPGAARLWLFNSTDERELAAHASDPALFTGPALPYYRLRIRWSSGHVEEREDPYRFGPVMGQLDEHLIGEGEHQSLWNTLGAHLITHEKVPGVHFALWAPNAQRVSVVGDFNAWNGTAHPMRSRGATGVWELFLPGLGEGVVYKYEIIGPDGTLMPLKADPVGFGSEHPPATGSVVRHLGTHHWQDQQWVAKREEINSVDAAISIYEVHLGSWRRTGDGSEPLSYLQLAAQLVDYAAEMGFTHIEVMPISEHPFDGSWGYQPIGLFAPTIRYGTGQDFAAFIDAAHARGLGVIADWVPGHFPTDQHGLGRFDGTALYEHLDPREGFHPDWNTLIYNYGRPEVRNFLVANALYWLGEYHLDGLRVDAVASMINRDYSRAEGQWIANKDGGNENYEALDFLKQANAASYARHPGIAMIAEDSTAYPGVTRPVHDGGLGFGYKWNLGWMNDSLEYFGKDPVYRKHHHNQLTFGITYAFSENFLLPISHDEVVHGKGSMYSRMPGSHADKLGNLKAFYGYMWAYPGKKLLFMGQEFGQPREWNYQGALDWEVLDDPGHAGVRTLVRDLNRLYREQPALHRHDTRPEGFQWLLVDDKEHQVFAWLRRGEPGDAHVVVVVNLTPVERTGFRIGFPVAGRWIEALNTDSENYHGANRGHGGAIETETVPAGGEAQSALLTLPPLSAIYFVEERS